MFGFLLVRVKKKRRKQPRTDLLFIALFVLILSHINIRRKQNLFPSSLFYSFLCLWLSYKVVVQFCLKNTRKVIVQIHITPSHQCSGDLTNHDLWQFIVGRHVTKYGKGQKGRSQFACVYSTVASGIRYIFLKTLISICKCTVICLEYEHYICTINIAISVYKMEITMKYYIPQMSWGILLLVTISLLSKPMPLPSYNNTVLKYTQL